MLFFLFFFFDKNKTTACDCKKEKAQKKTKWQQSRRLQFRHKRVKRRIQKNQSLNGSKRSAISGLSGIEGKNQCASGYIHWDSCYLTSPHFIHLTSLLFPDKLFLIFTIHLKPTVPSCLLLILADVKSTSTEKQKATWTSFLSASKFLLLPAFTTKNTLVSILSF